MGTNAVFIAAGSNRPGGLRMGSWAIKTLTMDDVQAILREVPMIREAAPAVMSRAQGVYQNQNWSTGILGTTPNYFEIRSWAAQSGVAVSQEEGGLAGNVCVVGKTVANFLLANESPVRKVI